MKIYPIKTGTIRCNGSVITSGRGYDKSLDIPATAWLIEAPEGPFLVDTGMCDTAHADTCHYPGSRQEEGQRIDLALNRLGVSPDDVKTIILTHLHWDHCYNLNKFENARIVVQRRELQYALDPLPPYYNSYESEEIGMEAPFKDVKCDLVDGDADISREISVISTPGHSPGHQSVIVSSESRNYVIAGDAVMSYDNLEANARRKTRFSMIGRYLNVEDAWGSMERIADLDAYVLPSHDDRVFDSEVYR